MHLAGFEPEIPAREQLQTHTQGHVATGIGLSGTSLTKNTVRNPFLLCGNLKCLFISLYEIPNSTYDALRVRIYNVWKGRLYKSRG